MFLSVSCRIDFRYGERDMAMLERASDDLPQQGHRRQRTNSDVTALLIERQLSMRTIVQYEQ
jgi:hypothetical protein